MMHQELWHKIVSFELDDPSANYGFSTRLANENFWTSAFTEQAILEYKKFMYLAATVNTMVSPSEVVDKVWHLHLLFTESYQEFCHLLGKYIHHIPSTRSKKEFEQFSRAKEQTKELYEEIFGKQPANIWYYADMFDSLNLPKATISVPIFLLLGIVITACLATPAYFLLLPIYSNINNPDFVNGLAAVYFFVLILLEWYNTTKLQQILTQFAPTSFVYTLQPFELVYLTSTQISKVIAGTINELIDNGGIKIKPNNSLELTLLNKASNKEHWQVVHSMKKTGTILYVDLVKKLESSPIFANIANSMEQLNKYMVNSRVFGRLFYTNFAILALLLLLSSTRIAIGIVRQKPVAIITFATIIGLIISIFFLYRLTTQLSRVIIPNYYKNQLTDLQITNNWRWKYFLMGTASLLPTLIPLLSFRYDNHKRENNGGSCGTFIDSSGGSCGSSCSSCGGCGT